MERQMHNHCVLIKKNLVSLGCYMFNYCEVIFSTYRIHMLPTYKSISSNLLSINLSSIEATTNNIYILSPTYQCSTQHSQFFYITFCTFCIIGLVITWCYKFFIITSQTPRLQKHLYISKIEIYLMDSIIELRYIMLWDFLCSSH